MIKKKQKTAKPVYQSSLIRVKVKDKKKNEKKKKRKWTAIKKYTTPECYMQTTNITLKANYL